MSVVKIHTDDLKAIYDILGDVLTKKPGRPSKDAAEDLRKRAGRSADLIGTMLGAIGPLVTLHEVAESNPKLTSQPQTGAEIAAAKMEASVEEVVETVAADITPEPSIEGDDSPAP